MKRAFLLGLVSLMTMLASMAKTTDDPSALVFDSIWVEGNMRAQLVQRLYVKVTNTGDSVYYGVWRIRDAETRELIEASIDAEVIIGIESGETQVIPVDFLISKQGNYTCEIVRSLGASVFVPLGAEFSVNIAPYSAPRLKGEIHLDMLEQTNEANYLYGDFSRCKMNCSITITNEEEYPYFGDTIMLWSRGFYVMNELLDLSTTTYYGDTAIICRDLFSELAPRATVTLDDVFPYYFTAKVDEGKAYYVILGSEKCGLDTLYFYPKQGTNTYWTADRHVKPLPVEGDVLQVPDDAVAVDLRGLYNINTVYKIEPSKNPNCLYYLNYMDYVPQGFETENNIIRDYEAKCLSINNENDYYCPMAFKAKDALFRNDWGQPAATQTAYYYTPVVFPFDVQHVTATNINDASRQQDLEFNGRWIKVCHFAGSEVSSLYFIPMEESSPLAYKPYMLGLSEGAEYLFYSENITIPSTREAVESGEYFDFVASTKATTYPQGFYIIDMESNEEGWAYKLDSETVVPPFRAVIDGRKNPGLNDDDILYLCVVDMLPSPTAITSVAPEPADGPVAVYSLSGQRVGTAQLAGGHVDVNGLKAGIYIAGGRKIVVK